MQRYPRRQFGVAVMEHHPLAVNVADHADDVINIHGRAVRGIEHMPPGGEGHFPVLKVEIGGREFIEVADMVIMKMGDNDVLDRCRIDTDGGQAFGRTPDQGAAPVIGGFGSETHIDNEGALIGYRRPDKIINGHGFVRVRGVDEVGRCRAFVAGVFDRVQRVDAG